MNLLDIFIVIIAIILCFGDHNIFIKIIAAGIIVYYIYNTVKVDNMLDNLPFKDIQSRIISKNKEFKNKFKNKFTEMGVNLGDITIPSTCPATCSGGRDTSAKIEIEMEMELQKERVSGLLLELNSIKNKNKELEDEIKQLQTTTAVTSNFSTQRDRSTTQSATQSTTQSTDIALDGDELMSHNNLSRNEPTRVIMGMTQAYQNLNKYVLEEVTEEEHREWWGENDY
jgi:hypothetical protein